MRLILLLCVLHALQGVQTKGDVVVFNEDEAEVTHAALNAAVAQHAIVVLYFHTDWCGECPAWTRTYQQTKESLRDNTDALLLRVDALHPTNHEVADSSGVSKYPTIVAFTQTMKGVKYDGARHVFELADFIKHLAGPRVHKNPPLEEVLGARRPDILLGTFAAFEGEGYEAFVEAAVTTPAVTAKVKYVACTDPTLIHAILSVYDKTFTAPDTPEATFFLRSFTPYIAALPHTPGVNILHEHLERLILPPVIHLQPTTGVHSDLFVHHPYVKVIYFPGTEEISAKTAFLLGRVVAESSVPLRVAWVSKSFVAAEGFFTADTLKKPCFVVVDRVGQRYAEVVKDALSHQDIITMVDEVDAGAFSEPPRIKSEQIDEPQNAEQIATLHYGALSAENFQRDVEASNVTVAVLLRVPWCRFSEQLLPEFENVALAFSQAPSVTLYTMDAAKNDLPDSAAPHVKGFPTILLYTHSMKRRAILSPFVYDGNRSSASIAHFILSHSEKTHAYHATPETRVTLLRDYLSEMPPTELRGTWSAWVWALWAGMNLPMELPGEFETTMTECLFWAMIGVPGVVVTVLLAMQAIWTKWLRQIPTTQDVADLLNANERPDLLHKIPMWMTQYKNHEELLIPHLKRKYNLK